MDPSVYRILEHKRFGRPLKPSDLRVVVDGAADGSWGEAELGAFLMAVAIHGLDPEETRELTLGMLESGEQWRLAQDFPTLGDKHSTGGVGDKVSLVLSPIMAACGRPVVMLTGRGLGHTGGTADKLEAIPGLRMEFDRDLCCRALDETGFAIGIATTGIAPADRRLYALRDRTGTVASLPLITGSILSKKLATGAASIVFDVKTGNGAFMEELDQAEELARMLVETSTALGCKARALVSDMSQPLGRWVGHSAEVREALECLAGGGPDDFMEIVLTLCEVLSELTGPRLDRTELQGAVDSGRAREAFYRWAEFQGAEVAWDASPRLELAPHEVVLEAPRSGYLARIETRRLGELLARAGGGRLRPGAEIDNGVSLRLVHKLGDEVRERDELARLYLRDADEGLVADFRACFTLADEGRPVQLVHARL